MPYTNIAHPEERCAAARLEGRTVPVASTSRSGARKVVVIRLLVLLLIAVALTGCGKKGAPQPPPDEPNTFPRSYPNV
jgi:predicted small lipoprotein YifL